ncbi:MAG: BrnA antitoxin family protein [Xanthomonadales bacterium]
MKTEYDLSEMKSRRNPYADKLKRQVTIRMAEDVIDYFKALGEEIGIPYQTLINMYLRDCMVNKRRPDLSWG